MGFQGVLLFEKEKALILKKKMPQITAEVPQMIDVSPQARHMTIWIWGASASIWGKNRSEAQHIGATQIVFSYAEIIYGIWAAEIRDGNGRSRSVIGQS